MIKHSIYTSAYNLNKMGFNYQDVLWNWAAFLNGTGQIVIAVNTSDDDTYDSLRQCQMYAKMSGGNTEWTIFKTDIPYSDPLFDGKIKNEALKRCTGEFCTLLDMDEVLPLHTRAAWDRAMGALSDCAYDAAFLSVIDLFHNERHYKTLGQKWYLHKNQPYLRRGRVAFAARADGTTDISRSDTCELINEDGTLAHAAGLFTGMPDHAKLTMMAQGLVPYVVHLGWLTKQQRLRQSAFWAPVWSARDGTKVEQPLTEAELDQTPYYPHNLPHWNAE